MYEKKERTAVKIIFLYFKLKQRERGFNTRIPTSYSTVVFMNQYTISFLRMRHRICRDSLNQSRLSFFSYIFFYKLLYINSLCMRQKRKIISEPPLLVFIGPLTCCIFYHILSVITNGVKYCVVTLRCRFLFLSFLPLSHSFVKLESNELSLRQNKFFLFVMVTTHVEEKRTFPPCSQNSYLIRLRPN